VNRSATPAPALRPAWRLALVCLLATAAPVYAGRPHPRAHATVAVTVDVARGPVNTFRPDQALGGAIDGGGAGITAATFRPGVIGEMLTAGLRPVTYRLRTELGIEAWHWNPRGQWSDPGHRRGYWTSDDDPADSITVSWGYRLPRRGNTIDQANNDGWSRIDDGDTTTFWKSNPYLDPHFTGADGEPHDQWVLVDLGRRMPVDAIRILWGTPYAADYTVQHWSGAEDPREPDDLPDGRWETFPAGDIRGGSGGLAELRLAPAPVAARWIRVLLHRASGTAPAGSTDVRDRLGYAIREMGIGEMEGGRFVDRVAHAASHAGQTVMYVSSTDPWHRAEDIDRDTEQPGLDRVAASGIGRGLPMLVPVGVLFGTPEDAAAELRWLRARRIPLRGMEIGEEPDGQWMRPEDYASLYLRVADALRGADPTVVLGGPSLQTPYTGEMAAWTAGGPQLGWMGRFLRVLRARGRMRDLAFFSYEWYPWDETCAAAAPQLAAQPARLAEALESLHRDGLPADLPAYVTEYGWSAFSGEAEVNVEGALLNADIVGTALEHGADAAYLYGYPPARPERAEECDRWGNNMMFLERDAGPPLRLATYWGARMMAEEWAEPGRGAALPHQAFGADVTRSAGGPLVTAYAVHRPDGQWAVMLINKDPSRSASVRLRFRERGRRVALAGAADLYRFERAQYAWHAAGAGGAPVRSNPPEHLRVPGGAEVALPPWSLTVVRGRIAGGG